MLKTLWEGKKSISFYVWFLDKFEIIISNKEAED